MLAFCAFICNPKRRKHMQKARKNPLDPQRWIKAKKRQLCMKNRIYNTYTNKIEGELMDKSIPEWSSAWQSSAPHLRLPCTISAEWLNHLSGNVNYLLLSALFYQYPRMDADDRKGIAKRTIPSTHPQSSVVIRLQPKGGLSVGILIWSGNDGFWRKNLAKPNNKKVWRL